MQHQQGPGGIPRLQAAGFIQAHHTQAALDQGQRVPVGLIWIEEGKEMRHVLVYLSENCSKLLRQHEVEERLSRDLSSAHLWLVPILFSHQMSGYQEEGVSLQRFLPFSWFSPAGMRSPSRWAACCLRLHPTRKTSEKNRLQKSCVPLLYHFIT